VTDTTFKVKGQLAGCRGILWRPPAKLVDKAIDQWRGHFHACMRARGHFNIYCGKN